jgi:hypothetical protein
MLASNDDQLFLTDSQYQNAERRQEKMTSGLGEKAGNPIKTAGKILDLQLVINDLDASNGLCAWIGEAAATVRKVDLTVRLSTSH